MANATVQHTPDKYAVVATVGGKTQLWGTAGAGSDPEALLRSFPLADFGPTSGNHLKVVGWPEWIRIRDGLIDVQGAEVLA